MQKTVSLMIAGCAALAGIGWIAAPASAATAATPAIHYGETNAGVLQPVGRRYGRRHWRRGYYRPYSYYAPYAYRPYAYYGSPYGYYGRPYGYYGWGRPGVSLWFGF
jgi:hypothetical protein